MEEKMVTVNSDYIKDIMKSLLKTNKVHFKFQKKDGNERMAIGTTNVLDVIKRDDDGNIIVKPTADHLVKYYDLEKDGWRCFILSNLTEIIKIENLEESIETSAYKKALNKKEGEYGTMMFDSETIKVLYFDFCDGDEYNGIKRIECSEMVDDGKYSYCDMIIENDGKYYNVEISRNGSYFTDYNYNCDDWPKDIKLIQVKKTYKKVAYWKAINFKGV